MGAYGKKHNIAHFSLVVDICTFACRKRKKQSKCNSGGITTYFTRAFLFLFAL